jgi:hypothetical protein
LTDRILCRQRSLSPHPHEFSFLRTSEVSGFTHLRKPIPFHRNVQIMDLLPEGVAIQAQ